MPFESKNKDLIDKLQEALSVKRSTARVYASTLATLARNVNIPPRGCDQPYVAHKETDREVCQRCEQFNEAQKPCIGYSSWIESD